MKNTLRLIAAVAMLALAAPVYAQGGAGGRGGQQMSPEQQLARQKEMLFKGITLSADQSAKADTIIVQGLQKQRQMMQEARSGGGRPDMSQMQKLNAERNSALKALLATDEEKKAFDENLANMPMGRRGGGRN